MGAARGTRQHRSLRRQLRHSRAELELVAAELDQISQRRSSTALGSIRGSLYSRKWKNIFDSDAGNR